MITVIKHGSRRKLTCPDCGCEFIFQNEDIMYGDQRDYYSEVKCPDCGHRCDTEGKY